MRIFVAALLVPLGALLLYLGELDDSPGLGGIGLILGATGVVVLLRTFLLRRSSGGPRRPA